MFRRVGACIWLASWCEGVEAVRLTGDGGIGVCPAHTRDTPFLCKLVTRTPCIIHHASHLHHNTESMECIESSELTSETNEPTAETDELKTETNELKVETHELKTETVEEYPEAREP